MNSPQQPRHNPENPNCNRNKHRGMSCAVYHHEAGICDYHECTCSGPKEVQPVEHPLMTMDESGKIWNTACKESRDKEIADILQKERERIWGEVQKPTNSFGLTDKAGMGGAILLMDLKQIISITDEK